MKPGNQRGRSVDPAAQDRLRRAVVERTGDQRDRTYADLAFVDALLSVGADQDAARLLEEYQTVLRAYARDIERAVAGATRDDPAPADDPPRRRRAARALRRGVSATVAVLAAALTGRA